MSLLEAQSMCQSAPSFALDAVQINPDMSPAFWALTDSNETCRHAFIKTHMKKKLMLWGNKAVRKRKVGKRSPEACVLDGSFKHPEHTSPTGGLDRDVLRKQLALHPHHLSTTQAFSFGPALSFIPLVHRDKTHVFYCLD